MKRYFIFILASIMLSSSLMSCSDSYSNVEVTDDITVSDTENTITINTDNTEDITTNNTADILSYSRSIPAATKDPSGKECDEKFVSAVTDFSSEIVHKCAKKGENFIMSPLSVTFALSLCANGADGETANQLVNLNKGISVLDMDEYLYSYALRLASTKESTVKIASSVWSDDLFTLNDQFRWVSEKYFNADAMTVDMANPKTSDIINSWVSEKTDNMIEHAVGEIDPMTAAILINTVLFDGIWQDEYEDFDVYEREFTDYDGKTELKDFLHSTEKTYFEVNGGVGFSKAYKDGYDFVAVLPDGDVYDFINDTDISEIINAYRNGRDNGYTVHCRIPKFEYDFETELNDTLSSLGVKDLFSPENCNLSLLGTPDDLYVSTILQKAKVKLDEHGTKAAAVTEIMVMCTAIAPMDIQEYYVTLDRPFYYMIVDRDSGIPLFCGITAYID